MHIFLFKLCEIFKLTKRIPGGFYLISQEPANVRKDKQGCMAKESLLPPRAFTQILECSFVTSIALKHSILFYFIRSFERCISVLLCFTLCIEYLIRV